MKLFITLLTILLATSAHAANQLDSTNGDWSVYTDGKGVCYIASIPTSEDGNFKERGQPYVLVSGKGKVDEVNISSGYPFRTATDAELSVEGKRFKLFTKDKTAWAKSAADDKSIVAAMKNGSKMEVKGVSIKASYSTDSYSLKGFGAAYKRLKQLCK